MDEIISVMLLLFIFFWEGGHKLYARDAKFLNTGLYACVCVCVCVCHNTIV
jgi:hypothetical protein